MLQCAVRSRPEPTVAVSAALGQVRRSPQNVRMILEHAVLDVISGEEPRFERAFAEAKSIIASMPGFRSLALDRCLEQPTGYLLRVEWERLEDHTEGFRGSPEYEKWRALLHHFYEPFPVVEHYTSVVHV